MTSVNDTDQTETRATDLPPMDEHVGRDTIEQERQLIGHVLANPAHVSTHVLALPAEHMSSDGHAALWTLAVERSYAGHHVADLPAVMTAASEHYPEYPGIAERAQDYMLRFGIAASAVPFTAATLVDEVTRGHVARDTQRTLVRAWQALNNGRPSMAREIMTGIDPDAGRTDHWYTLNQAWDAALADAENPASVIPSPWDTVNTHFAGGLHSGRLYVVMGAPGTGKTVTFQQIADRAAQDGHVAAAFSLEMSLEDLARRQMSTSGGVPMSETMRPRLDLTTESLAKIDHVRNTTGSVVLVDPTQELTDDDVRSRARVAVRRHQAELVLLDYAQLVEATDSRLSEYEQISRTIKKLTGMSRELDVPVVVLVQPNRNAAMQGRKLDLHDAHGSSAVEKYAAGALVLNTVYEDDDEGNRAPSGMVDIDIAKNRFGPSGVTVRTVADLSHQTFAELPK